MRVSKEINSEVLNLRPAKVVMDLDRLGSMHQSRLSFMRSLVRRIMREQWEITPAIFNLDDQGYGLVVYKIVANEQIYSMVIFSNYLADEDRNDRVIADQWDLTFSLCLGEPTASEIEIMRANVPLQEEGRMHADMMVLSRANRSSRNFEYVIGRLANGLQPDAEQLTKVGYLYRTTAVYGSGKFGLADWRKIKSKCAAFNRPFAAEMFSCYLLRQFSIEQAEHIAQRRAPETFKPLSNVLKRFIGIGNSTGLGMAPFLIKHPLLISNWLYQREIGLARIENIEPVAAEKVARLIDLLAKAQKHFQQTFVVDEAQIEKNNILKTELFELHAWLQKNSVVENWAAFLKYSDDNYQLETQELLRSLLLELYPEIVDALEDNLCVDEDYVLDSAMPINALLARLEESYDWVLDIDFSDPDREAVFWYRSEEKMEPRLGVRNVDPGQDDEIRVTIARDVSRCYADLKAFAERYPETIVAHFLLENPVHKGIVKRIQTMSNDYYGEIRANVADKNILPMNLLRCKLSFFGVSKFDPKSKLWVRNTMFQGAPTVDDIGKPFSDDWCFPLVEDFKSEGQST